MTLDDKMKAKGMKGAYVKCVKTLTIKIFGKKDLRLARDPLSKVGRKKSKLVINGKD